MATSVKKIPGLIGEAVETGVDIIKGIKRQPLETVDYIQPTILTKADDTKSLTSAENLVQHYKKGATEKRIADRTAASKSKFNNDFIAKAIEAMNKPQVINRWNPEIQNKYFHLADDWKKISNKDTFADRSYVLSKLLEHDYGIARSVAANLDKAVRSKHLKNPDDYDDLLTPQRWKSEHASTDIRDRAIIEAVNNLKKYSNKNKASTGRELRGDDLLDVMWPLSNKESAAYREAWAGGQGSKKRGTSGYSKTDFRAMVHNVIRNQYSDQFQKHFNQYSTHSSIRKSLVEQKTVLENKSLANLIKEKGWNASNFNARKFRPLYEPGLVGQKNLNKISDLVGQMQQATLKLDNANPKLGSEIRKSLHATINRLLRTGFIKDKNATVDNMMQFIIPKNPEKFIEKYLGLLNKRINYRDDYLLAQRMTGVEGVEDISVVGLDPKLNIAHLISMGEDYKLGMQIDNLFLLGEKANLAASGGELKINRLLNEMKALKKNKPNDKAEIQKLRDELTTYIREDQPEMVAEIQGMKIGEIPETPKTVSDLESKIVSKIHEVSGLEEGGLVKPHMAYGGDMAQFTEMESVVPDLNPAEAGMEGYTQLAMSIPKFRNPFKKVDPPPIMSDAVSGIKITDKTKKGAKIEGTIKTEGQTPVFHLKSDLELANAAQDKMTPQQWFGYLKKKGVSETELHEFGLGNIIKNAGGWEQIEKIKNGKKVLDQDGNVVMIDKWKSNVPITKSELISQYKNNKPIISYKIQQMEPFEKGWKDFQNFLTGQRSGGRYFNDLPAGAREFEEMRQLRNKPQDIIGDRLRSNIVKFSQEISDRTGRDIKTAWPQLEPQITSNINQIIKEAYGIENVIENGFGNVKVPFYTQNLVNRFRRLKSGEGFYMGKTGVKHEGSQFLEGGTGYIEIPFTYNPNPKGMRANEPKFTFGEGHFTNPSGNNPVFWLRASERVDERGKRVFLIEEIQSDMHQKPKQKPDTFKYAQRHDAPGFMDQTFSLAQLKKLKGDLVKLSDQIDKVTGHTDPSAVTVMERLKVKREALRNQISKAERTIMDAQDAAVKDETFPEGPWKKSENQAKIAIKTLINLATQEGFDSVALITAKAKNYVVGADPNIAKGNRGFYDNIAVSGMKNVAKNLNLEFSSTNIKDGKGNTWAKIPIINLKKEPVKASVDMYKSEGGFIYRPSFVDVVPVL